MNYSDYDNEKQIKKRKSKKNKVANSALAITARIVVVAVIIAGFLAAGAVFGAYMGIVESVPEIHVDEVLPDAYTSVINDANGNEIDRLHGDENREYAKLSEIPVYLQNATVAVEDMRFFTHNGIDLRGMARAVYTNLKDQSLSEGASTITQQLIKNNILKDPSKKWRRKLQEQYIAVEYEKALQKASGSKQKAKEYILEIYLNSIPLGHGNNGVKAAAKYYFNKELSELTLAECASIAAITNNPSLYSPKSNEEGNNSRRMKILDDMLAQEMITQAEYDEAANEDVYAKVQDVFMDSDNTQYFHSYFIDQVVTEVANDLVVRRSKTLPEAYNLIYNGGLTINTTLDQSMQAVIDEKFKDDTLYPEGEFEYKVDYFLSVINSITGETTHHSLEGHNAGYIDSLDEIDAYMAEKRAELMVQGDEVLGERYEAIPQPQAAMVIIDYHNGHVKALTGGRGDKTLLGQRPLNRATQSPRQPGSVFKVLTTFAPGIDSLKIAAATIVEDSPLKIGSKQFGNHWGSEYRGPMSMRKAVESSANVVTVRTLVDHVGIETMWEYLMNFGFTTLVDGETRGGVVFSDKNPATALGGITDGVTVMELAAAYGTIANEGKYYKPVLYTTVLDHSGQLLLDNTEAEHRQVMKPQAAYIVTDMMEDVITSGTGGYARLQNVKMPVAGKTGTTSDDKDLIFAGYTPYYASAIWMGHDMPKRMSYTRSPHLRLWSAVMDEIHTGLEYKAFARPDGIVSGTVCAVSGKLPGDKCGDKLITDMFIAGTVPTETCEEHIVVEICTVSGKLANEFCPEEFVETVVRNLKASEGEDGEKKDEESTPGEICDVHNELTMQELENPSEIPEWIFPGIINPEFPAQEPDDNSWENNNNNVETPPQNEEPQQPEESTPPDDSAIEWEGGNYIQNPDTGQYEWIPN